MIDLKTEILEAVGFKFWNATEPNKFCRMRYAGPKFVLANHTSQCYRGINSDWLEGNTLEGHPCKDSSNETNLLSDLNLPFHEETCVRIFQSSQDDIQVKRLNGFFKIYCYGHNITVGLAERRCPEYVFELPLSERFILNGHENTPLQQTKILIHSNELAVNKYIARTLRLEETKILGINTTNLNATVDSLKQRLTKLKNVTLKELSLSSALTSLLDGITNVYWLIESVVMHGLIFGVCVIVLILAPPIIALLKPFIVIARGLVMLWWNSLSAIVKRETVTITGRKYHRLKSRDSYV